MDKVEAEIGGYFAYSLYDDCWYENDFQPPKKGNERNYWGPPKFQENKQNMLGGALNDYKCGGA